MKKNYLLSEAGLGQGPFTYLGNDTEPWSCEYCGTFIVNRFHVKSANGKHFILGSDCIEKLDKKLNIYSQVETDIKKAQRQRENKRIEAAKIILPSVETKLIDQDHPMRSRETLLDYVNYLFIHGGHAGQLKAARIVEKHNQKGGE